MGQQRSILLLRLRLQNIPGKLLASTALICVAILVSNNRLARTANPTARNLQVHDIPGSQMNGNGMSVEEKHNHRELEIPPGQPIPSVNLIVHKDPIKGWNLEVQASNFRFAPHKVSTTTQTTAEGHAHLYIDGQKITRLYGNWYYLENLKPGLHKVTVGLNANDHKALVHNAKPIEDTETIDVAAPSNQGNLHRH